MIHYFCYGVEPLPDHPKFYDVQAGCAHVFLRGDDTAAIELVAQSMLTERRWKIQRLHSAHAGDESTLAALPPETQLHIQLHGYCIEFVCYETGGGPEEAGHPFE